MIKTYLDNAEELIKAFEGNRKFCNEIYERVYEDYMDMQEMEARDADIKGLDIHDHYNTFYLTIRDRDQFLESAIDNDCLVTNKNRALHKELREALNRFYSMEYSNKQYDNLDRWLDIKAEELMEEWENILHSYEDPSKYDILDYILNNSDIFIDIYKDNYVIDNDYSKIYIDIPSHTKQEY